MTDQATLSESRQHVIVRATRERAFSVFTEGFAQWWPMAHHIGASDPLTIEIEPLVGGRWFERGADGVECDWGKVRVWEPPARLVLAWHLDPDFNFDPDDARSTEVEVTCTDDSDGTVRVELVHRGFEVHGPDLGAKLRAGVSAEGGWPAIIRAYVDRVNKPAGPRFG